MSTHAPTARLAANRSSHRLRQSGEQRFAGRLIIKRILREHGFPPDKQEKATNTVLEQAEALLRECLEE